MGEIPSFCQCGGVPGRRYEQLRMAALDGNETGDFMRCGMTMVVPEFASIDGRLWTVKRTRASIRAGEVSMKDLLDELGILAELAGSVIGVDSKRVTA